MIKKFFNKSKLLIFWGRHSGVCIGKNCFVSSKFWSTEPYLIKIGDNCQLTEGVKCFTHGGAGAVREKYPDFDCFGKVCIGNYIYLGTNTLVMPGVSIGNNVICAAGSVITKSIPSNVVVGGNPARIICTIDEYVQKNEKYNLNSKNMNEKKKKKLLLNLNDDLFIKK